MIGPASQWPDLGTNLSFWKSLSPCARPVPLLCCTPHPGSAEINGIKWAQMRWEPGSLAAGGSQRGSWPRYIYLKLCIESHLTAPIMIIDMAKAAPCLLWRRPGSSSSSLADRLAALPALVPDVFWLFDEPTGLLTLPEPKGTKKYDLLPSILSPSPYWASWPFCMITHLGIPLAQRFASIQGRPRLHL